MENKDKIILDLCGGTGAWSKPYKDNEYDVRIMDINKGIDVRLFNYTKEKIYGILAAPPCTYFCRMRMCRGRPTDKQFISGLSIVDACLRIILIYNPKFWCLENPQGYLKIWLGEPKLKFDPYEYGDVWTKRTWLWGNFNLPKKKIVKPIGPYIHRKKGKIGVCKNNKLNAVTPSGFAKAFYEANK